MAIIFSERVLHGTQAFDPKCIYEFGNDEAEAYFIKAFGAKPTDERPDVVIDFVEIDPDTIHNETRLRVADLSAGAEA